ncbi:hypothetical protein Q0590_16750 [Rhodocytophaga aerolata]|uniref:Proteinase inhibitor I42 chagasin domain-containing protein n=1 Tax=Rhodocytophaga aerolata TaxID=455078 RepID=A0ABT8R9I6_9BACT|nr:protease inhibitor I42 family protein [Rhodocytophaga aerolata]MDO1447923.1 hypothetical protein [Rhodocytophaga aerolata]
MHHSFVTTYTQKLQKQVSVVVLTLFCCSLAACGGMSSKNGYTFSEPSKKIKLAVGEIKEIRLTSQRDSTWQVASSSENKEIVDVTDKADTTEETTTSTVPDKGNMVFLVKGVTPGSVKISFAEKQKEEEGPGRILKTYQVEVVTK